MPARLLLIVFTVFLAGLSVAQNDLVTGNYDNGTNLNVLYRNEMSGKLFATTRGFGFQFRQGKHINTRTRSFYEIDAQTLKHPKELRLTGEADNRKRFVYGKLNTVVLLHGGLGLQNVIFFKGDIKAVEVRYSYSIGPTLAFAKPYYVQVYRNRPTFGEDPINVVRFDSENFSPDSGRVIGRGPLSRGINETVVYPGLSGRFNLSFEYAPYTNLIRAIDTGLSLDYFPKALPIMAHNPSENLILTVHVGFVFGRKWF
jgi:hypothetical protein